MGVMLQRDQAHQRLYLHNVLTIKEEATISSQDYSLTNWSDEDNPRLFITNILQNAINVKLRRKNISVLKNISDTKKFSLRDRLERGELADRFDRIAETAAEREIVTKFGVLYHTVCFYKKRRVGRMPTRRKILLKIFGEI